MDIGYIIAIIAAAVWLTFKIIEVHKQHKEEERAKEVIISSEQQLDDIIISKNSDD